MSREYHVKIGELRRGRTGEVLKTTLGSCVGIAILWKARGRYALAHCLLAESPSSRAGREIRKPGRSESFTKLAGGAG